MRILSPVIATPSISSSWCTSIDSFRCVTPLSMSLIHVSFMKYTHLTPLISYVDFVWHSTAVARSAACWPGGTHLKKGVRVCPAVKTPFFMALLPFFRSPPAAWFCSLDPHFERLGVHTHSLGAGQLMLLVQCTVCKLHARIKYPVLLPLKILVLSLAGFCSVCVRIEGVEEWKAWNYASSSHLYDILKNDKLACSVF